MRTKKESLTITNEFRKKFKSDMSTNAVHAILLSRDVLDADNDPLTMEVLDTKIFRAVTQSNPLKQPYLDGIQVKFYQKSGTIVDKLICNMVRSSFRAYVKRTKRGILCSKVNNLDSIGHCRPIGQCNISYR